MAVIDKERDVLMLRLAYDGPALAGKTTSVKALGDKLSRSVYTPEEMFGRTTFFDWMEYVGGLFDGRRIHCQVVTVPGQRGLEARRLRLLKDADGVIFVADTSRDRFDESLRYLRTLMDLVASGKGPKTRVVIQANKRDHPKALEMTEILKELAMYPVEDILETVAPAGTGVRETFVFGVRAALQRVREQSDEGLLKYGSLGAASGDELLQELRLQQPAAAQAATSGRSERDPSPVFSPAATPPPAVPGTQATGPPKHPTADTAANTEARPGRTEHWETPQTVPQPQPTIRPTADSTTAPPPPVPASPSSKDRSRPAPRKWPVSPPAPHQAAPATRSATESLPQYGPVESRERTATANRPRLPDAGVAVGQIWPAVEGRALLLELEQRQVELVRWGQGHWTGEVRHMWRLLSRQGAEHGTLAAAQDAFRSLVTRYGEYSGLLSPERCVVLAASGYGTWRLWQIARIYPSLRDRIVRALSAEDNSAAISALLDAAQAMLFAGNDLAKRGGLLPCGVDSLGWQDGVPTYLGFLPELPSERGFDPEHAQRNAIAELHSVLRSSLGDHAQTLIALEQALRVSRTELEQASAKTVVQRALERCQVFANRGRP